MRRSKKRVEQELGTNQMNGGMLAALAVYTLWYGFKLYRNSDTRVIVVDEVIETEPVYCDKTQRIIYVVKK